MVVQHFIWLLQMGLECIPLVFMSLFMTPVGWLVLIAFAASAIVAARDPIRPDVRWLVLLWPVLTSAAMIAAGVAYAYDGDEACPDAASDVASSVVEIVGLIHLGGVSVVVVSLRGMRAVAFTLLSIGTILFAGCTYAAGMSISGCWL